MIKINVNVDSTVLFLNAILRIIPSPEAGAKFELTKENTKVKLTNESKTVRTFFTTNCMTADEPTTFCFSDIPKLSKAINMLKSYYDKTDLNVVVNFNKAFLEYSNDVKFKLKVIKEKDEDLIKKYISKDIQTVFKPVFTFTTGETAIKRLNSYAGLVSNDCKVYILKEGDKIVGEIDNKANASSNSVGLPIGTNITGTVDKVISTKLENFKLFTTLPSENIQVTYNDVGALEVVSKCTNDKYFIDMYMLCSTQKD